MDDLEPKVLIYCQYLNGVVVLTAELNTQAVWHVCRNASTFVDDVRSLCTATGSRLGVVGDEKLLYIVGLARMARDLNQVFEHAYTYRDLLQKHLKMSAGIIPPTPNVRNLRTA